MEYISLSRNEMVKLNQVLNVVLLLMVVSLLCVGSRVIPIVRGNLQETIERNWSINFPEIIERNKTSLPLMIKNSGYTKNGR